eukprot:TRINITY_DN62112_c0_g1_i1.p1 TRINITY_DN62112_c0_g1~~TRINITY_DN62112_c0_g1_i1.p1  ORF type:complete len:255 (-),score=51.50 TRINITY_DN62112_c0_g1_i1:142-906(-)
MAREPEARDAQLLQAQQASPVEILFKSKEQLAEVLQSNLSSAVHVAVDDVVDMIAALRGVDRLAVIQGALSAWFSHATGMRVVEVESHEQRQQSEGDLGALLLFRVRLEGEYEAEMKKLAKGEELAVKLRDQLVASLPKDLVEQKEEKLKRMIQISWTRPGSIELGGVAALSLVVLIITAIGLSPCFCETCVCSPICSCVKRSGRGSDASLYHCAMNDLQQRGAEFEVNPDGSATLRVPPVREPRWGCPDCTLM